MKTSVTIESGRDGTYGAYLTNNDLPFGIIGDGQSIREAREDFLNSYAEMREYYREVNKQFPECDFEFRYDEASFLRPYEETKHALELLGA